jgi:sphingomyelin phosphodiesterase
MCCRPESTNTLLATSGKNASLPASRFGDFLCDTTADLGLSASASMHEFLNISSICFSIFTCDIASHDPDDQQSQDYVSYEEETSYNTFKSQLGDIVSIVLGLSRHC